MEEFDLYRPVDNENKPTDDKYKTAEILAKPMEFSSESIIHLDETRKWTMFMAVLGFIFIGLLIIALPIIIISDRTLGSSGMEYMAIFPLLLVMALYFFPIYFLYKFSVNAKKAVSESDSESLDEALRYMKYYYRFMGILIIVILSIYLIIGVISLATSAL